MFPTLSSISNTRVRGQSVKVMCVLLAVSSVSLALPLCLRDTHGKVWRVDCFGPVLMGVCLGQLPTGIVGRGRKGVVKQFRHVSQHFLQTLGVTS